MADLIRVMKVSVDRPGPQVVIRESSKDDLWAYCEDWHGELHIKFAEMTQAELDALPEFEGF